MMMGVDRSRSSCPPTDKLLRYNRTLSVENVALSAAESHQAPQHQVYGWLSIHGYIPPTISVYVHTAAQQLDLLLSIIIRSTERKMQGQISR